MALYKVVLKGSFQGQSIDNILYYRNGIGVDIGGFTIGGTKEVGDAVKAMVWPALRFVLPLTYELQQIDSYVYNDQDFNLVYQSPYTTGVQEFGLETSPTLNGPAPCGILKFILENRAILTNGYKPPKRGYLAIGPLSDSLIENDGSLRMTEGLDLKWGAICAMLANNVETILPIPAVFYPVRVHSERIGLALKLKIVSYSDVQAAVMRHFSSFRRSRMPEN